MSYIDGVVCAVPTAAKEEFRRHAEICAAVFKENGALAVNEGWGVEVPEGKRTSFPLAVQCREEETVCFSWVLWPSKEVRDEAWPKIMEDSRIQPETNPMPFDGKRMIFGGFELIVQA